MPWAKTRFTGAGIRGFGAGRILGLAQAYKFALASAAHNSLTTVIIMSLFMCELEVVSAGATITALQRGVQLWECIRQKGMISTESIFEAICGASLQEASGRVRWMPCRGLLLQLSDTDSAPMMPNVCPCKFVSITRGSRVSNDLKRSHTCIRVYVARSGCHRPLCSLTWRPQVPHILAGSIRFPSTSLQSIRAVRLPYGPWKATLEDH